MTSAHLSTTAFVQCASLRLIVRSAINNPVKNRGDAMSRSENNIEFNVGN